eukprot:scaffold70056_cov82-Phaeocystis_antarctica.AAC.2
MGLKDAVRMVELEGALINIDADSLSGCYIAGQVRVSVLVRHRPRPARAGRVTPMAPDTEVT